MAAVVKCRALIGRGKNQNKLEFSCYSNVIWQKKSSKQLKQWPRRFDFDDIIKNDNGKY